MGCTTSSQNTTGNKDQNSQKRQPAGEKSENGNVPAVEAVTCTDKTFKTANLDRVLRSDSSINLHQESAEAVGFAPGKLEKNSPHSLDLSNSKKTQKKPKELNQVMAWGKRRTTTENNFLEDLRLHRQTVTTVSDSRYEKEYETTEADETSRFIEPANSDETESSMSDLLNDLSHHNVGHRRVEHEAESFDASKIIDVEKFRAANATEKNKISNNDQDNGKLFRRDPDFNIQTKSSKEFHKLNSSLQDFTMDNKEEHSNDLYNEDDENLIESIEREFLLTHDNFLPGQIMN